MRDQLEKVRREKRARAMALARHGLAGTPPGDLDAISVPDITTPSDLGLAFGAWP